MSKQKIRLKNKRFFSLDRYYQKIIDRINFFGSFNWYDGNENKYTYERTINLTNHIKFKIGCREIF